MPNPHTHVALALLAAIALAAPLAAQQTPPPRPTNLQVLPDSISRGELISIMRSFSIALGVRCSHCHVEREVDGRVERDMAADDKVEKRIAREMLRMVGGINERLATMPRRADPPVAVRCATCHRGARLPRMLEDTLYIAYAAGGVDALVDTYHTLRTTHDGRAAYDFGPLSLHDLADRLLDEEMPADAAAVFALNLEAHRDFTLSHSGYGHARLAAGDTAAALESFRRVLEMDPQDRDAARMVEQFQPQ